jgi:hypothetical protein
MKSILLIVGFLVFLTSNSFAAPPDKLKTKSYLMKTNRALGVAHMTVKRTKNYNGTLAKAVRHQRVARKMFIAGNYGRAIAHSRRARVLAREVMKTNKGKTNTDFEFSAEENTMASEAPSDAELETEMVKEEPSELKDEDLMNGNLDLEVK